MCQGNGAAPAAWLDLSTVLQRISKRQHHGAKLETPISKVLFDTRSVLFVDDVELFIFKSYLDTEASLFAEAKYLART